MFLRHISKRRSLLPAALILIINLIPVAPLVAKARVEPAGVMPAKIKSCLPSNVKESEVVVYKSPRNITVAETLKSLKAQCTKGRLIGRDRREIRFFRPECFGYPPPDYQEIQANQRRELERLKAKYNVVVIECDRRIGSLNSITFLHDVEKRFATQPHSITAIGNSSRAIWAIG